MFEYVHEVEYLVRNRGEMVAYMERNFGMKPDNVSEDGATKEAHYRVGQTLLRIREPVPGSRQTKLLEKRGPGVHEVVWGVDNVPEVAQQLKARGVTLRDEQGFHQSGSLGYNAILIPPQDSLGVYFFHLADRPM